MSKRMGLIKSIDEAAKTITVFGCVYLLNRIDCPCFQAPAFRNSEAGVRRHNTAVFRSPASAF